MAKKAKSGKFSDDKLLAILAIVFFWIFIWIIPIWVIKPRRNFAVYHAKQALILFIAWVIISIAGSVIPSLGWWVIAPLGSIFLFVLWVIGIVNAATDKKKPLPLIGKFADKFDF